MKTLAFATPSNVTVAVAPGTVVLTLGTVAGCNLLDARIKNVSGGAVTGFKLQLQARLGGEWDDYIVDAGWTSLVNPNLRWVYPATGPHVLAATEACRVQVRLNGAYAARFHATSADGTTVMSIVGNIGNE